MKTVIFFCSAILLSTTAFAEPKAKKDNTLSVSTEAPKSNDAISEQHDLDKNNKGNSKDSSNMETMEGGGFDCSDTVGRSGIEGNVGRNSECKKTLYESSKNKKK